MRGGEFQKEYYAYKFLPWTLTEKVCNTRVRQQKAVWEY